MEENYAAEVADCCTSPRVIDKRQAIGHPQSVPHFSGLPLSVQTSGMTSQDQEAPVGQATNPWFALKVRSKHERVAFLHLRERGYEEFSPSYKVEHQWSDRTAPGVVGFAGFGKGPTPVPDHEIERVRGMVQSGLLITPWPFLKLGQTVLIEHRPLAEGLLKEVKGRLPLVVSIHLLQRSVSTEIDRSWVRPLKPPRQPGV
jgi:hypothetical protein